MMYKDFEIFFKDIYRFVGKTGQSATFNKVTGKSEDKFYFILTAKVGDKIFSIKVDSNNFFTTNKLAGACIVFKIDFPTLINKQLLPFL